PDLLRCLDRTIANPYGQPGPSQYAGIFGYPPWVQLYAARSLMMMDTNNFSLVTNIFQQTMRDTEPEVRVTAAVTYLNWCEPTSNSALDVLTDLVAGRIIHWDTEVKHRARERAEVVLADYFQRRTNLIEILKLR